ncbi:VOC family protein [Sphingomonas xinjiangensis]|uniref:PhnB protein n=1 Tax=Sphingomonas xinjiangensis TaxID=643568 RepID=A0A840YSD0_9SPHN|nr:VOC family protein [Sphingomonas xinjiangensis]MBB5712572.1 PhnB protein [Sphingomonas xinjiangensis]
MTIRTTTHLNFRGDARAALAFYQSVFGGELMAISYADAHAVTNPAEADQVIWGQVSAPDGFHIMAYDVPSATEWDAGTIPFFVSVRGDDAATLTAYWDKLTEGATVIQPLGPSGFSPLYGMVRDHFGVTWVMDLQVTYNAA